MNLIVENLTLPETGGVFGNASDDGGSSSEHSLVESFAAVFADESDVNATLQQLASDFLANATSSDFGDGNGTGNSYLPVAWIPDWNSTSSVEMVDGASSEKHPWDGSMYPSKYSMVGIILTAIFVTSLMIVIVVGNMLVIIAIVTEKTLKTIQNWFIASLAVSDFLVGLVVMPFSLANELMGYWIFGYWWCEIHQAVDVLLCTASILNICMISLDRYWSITKAVEYLKQRTPLRAAIMIFLVWIASFMISVPPLLGWKKPISEDDNLPMCQVSDDMGYVIYSAFGSFYIPSVIMVFVYIRIYIAARSRARRHMKRKNVVEAAKDKSTTTTSFSNASPPDRNKNSSSNKGATTATTTTTTTLTVGSGDSLCVRVPTTPASTPSPERKQQEETLSPTSPASPAKSVIIDVGDPVPPTNPSAVPPKMPQSVLPTTPSSLPTNGMTESSDAKGCGNGTAKAVKLASAPKTPPPVTPSVTTPPPVVYPQTSIVIQQEDCVSEMDHSSDSDQYRESKASVAGAGVGGDDAESHVPLRRLRRLCRPSNKKKKKRKKMLKEQRREEMDMARLQAPPKIRDPEREKRRIARKKERRATLILGLIMASFILSWLPFFMIYLLSGLKAFEVSNLTFAFAFWLGYVNSALNPIIYTIFSRDFRRAFRKILFK